MIESRRRLPTILRMAFCAFGAQLPGMRILVAGAAIRFQAQVGVVQILGLDSAFGRSRNLAGVVARLACQRFVFAQKRKSCQAVVGKGGLVNLSDLELPAIVFQVAADAIDLPAAGVVGARMIALFRVQTLLDIRVAIQAFETLGAQTEVVTGGALGGPFQVLMRPGKRTR